MEGPAAICATVQIVSAAIGAMGIQITGQTWLAVGFFTGVEPSTVATLASLGWIVILGAVGPVVVQFFAIGLAILGAKRPVFPRWVRYANLNLGLGETVGVLIPFFRTGPFAFNGLFGFGMVFTAFFTWVIVMWVCTAKAITVQASSAPTEEVIQ